MWRWGPLTLLRPAGLTALLLLPAIVLLHWLHRERQERRVPSLYLWRRLSRRVRRRSFWQQLLSSGVFWLQALAALTFALILARPVWTGTGPPPVEWVVVVDRSASLRASTTPVLPATPAPAVTPGDPTARVVPAQPSPPAAASPLPPGEQGSGRHQFNRGELLWARLDQLARAAPPGVRWTVIGAGPVPRLLARDVDPHSPRWADLRNELGPTAGIANWEATGRLVQAVMTERTEEVLLATDGGIPPAVLAAHLPQVTRIVDLAGDRTAATTFAQGASIANLGLVDLRLQPVGDSLSRFEVLAVVKNGGEVELPYTLSWSTGNRRLATDTGRLRAGEERRIVRRLALLPGTELALHLTTPGPDQLAEDDTAFAVALPLRSVRVLVASPGNPALVRALSLTPRVAVEEIGRPEELARMGPQDLARYDLLLFDRLPPPAWPPRPLVTIGLSPREVWPVLTPLEQAAVRRLEATGTESTTSVEWDDRHPLSRYVPWSEIRVEAAAAWPVLPGALPLWQSRDGALVQVAAGLPPRVFVAFPLQQSDWPERVSFPIWVKNLVDWTLPWAARPIGPVLRPGDPLPEWLLGVAGEAGSVVSPPAGAALSTGEDTGRNSSSGSSAGGSSWEIVLPDGRARRLGPEEGLRNYRVPEDAPPGPYWLRRQGELVAGWSVSLLATEETSLVPQPGLTPSAAPRTAVPGTKSSLATADPLTSGQLLLQLLLVFLLAVLLLELSLMLREGRPLPRLLANRRPSPARRRQPADSPPGLRAPPLGSSRHARRLAIALRLVALLLLVVALAGPHLPVGTPLSARIYLADLSDSIDPAARERVQAWLQQELGRRDRNHLAAVVAFGSEAVVDRPLLAAEDLPWPGFTSRPEGGATDIGSALALGAALAKPEAPSRLVLISDGGETTGSALLAAERVRQLGIPIDVLPLPGALGHETGVAALDVAPRVHRGETVLATLLLYHSGLPDRVPLTLQLDGGRLWSGEITVQPGKNALRFPVTFPAEGLARLEAVISPRHDGLRENNRAQALVFVTGSPRVLVASREPTLAAALEQGGLQVELRSPLTLPARIGDYAPYSALILDDVPAYLLNNPQLAAIRLFVERLGGGLLVLGGPNSFGPGGYFGTPLDEVLPVYSEAPERVYAPSLTMLLVLDQSGSMGDMAGGQTKLQLAQEAALRAVSLLSPGDLVGVIAFESSPVWVVPLQRAENQAIIRTQIGRLQAGGGTTIAPALEEAIRALEGLDSAVKHVILLTDGRGESSDFSAQIRRLRQLGATVSTVAVGKDADRDLLARLAEQGEGRYYFAEDPQQVPSIFAAETATVAQDLRVNRRFRPREVRPASFIRALVPSGELPPLDGFTITTAKPGAIVHYVVPPEDHPLLASGRFGLGQTLVFTSSPAGDWGKSWREWPLLTPLLLQLVRSVLPEPPGTGLNARLELLGDRAELALEALNPDGTYRHYLEPRATLLLPDGNVLQATMNEIEPGLYRASFPAGQPGEYVATVQAGESRVLAAASLPYSAEYREAGANLALLFELSALTGGHMLSFSDSAWDLPTGRTPAGLPLAPYLVLLGALVFLADLAARYLTAAARARLGRAARVVLDRMDKFPLLRSLAAAGRRAGRYLGRRSKPATAAAPVPPAETLPPEPTPAEDFVTAVEERLRQRLAELQRHPVSRWQAGRPAGEDGTGYRAARLYLARRRRRKQS